MTLPIQKIDALLAELKKLPPSQKREQTFMEIAGYPNYENVCSNILQFYFQPANEHGLGTLLLDALAKLIKEETVIGGQIIDVRREEITAKRNRIDLVIESDDYVLGIENKIFAPLNNDLCDYVKHLQSLSKGRKKVYKVLLSMRPIKPSSALKCFCPITYESFFQKVIENIGSYFLTAREPYITFLRDFIQTIQNLQRSTSMDQERLTYFHNNQQDIVELVAEVNSLRTDMRTKLKQLNESIASNIDSNIVSESGLWQHDTRLEDVAWYVVKINDSSCLQLLVVISPAGWEMRFPKKYGFPRKSGRSFKQVEQVVAKQGIKFRYSETGNSLIYDGKNNKLPYETDIDTVKELALDMLKRLTA